MYIMRVHHSEFLNALSHLFIPAQLLFLLLLTAGDPALDSSGPETGLEEINGDLREADFLPE
jgi:hypothetical protein